MRFIGRTTELAALENAWASPGGAFVPVYGRRRVGKSALLLRFLKDHAGVYYVGKLASAELQRSELLQMAAQTVGEPLLASLSTASWKDALSAVVDRWKGPGKLVLVLDEFQWLAEASPELPSVLQELWDTRWKRGSVMLVLCGSYIGFMEREVLGRKSPLFGRRTAQILLRPFDPVEARRFHPGYSLVDVARTRFICGGIPRYLEAFDPSASVEQNIRSALLDEHAPLFREPEFLLREELRDLANYQAILMALSSGSARAAEIAAATGLPERSLPYYLDQLEGLGYVRRRHPLTDGGVRRRDVRFALEDPLLRFWYRFVWPNLSLLAQLGPDRVYAERIAPHIDSWMGLGFEALCRESLPRLYAREGVTAAFEVGEYWSKTVQIDVVGLRDDGWTDLGECRWGDAGDAVADLKAKVPHYPNARNATIGLRVFARRGRKAPEGVRWHGLTDLLED